MLRGLGFDMYDDILNHETYDHYPHCPHRIDAMHGVIPTFDNDGWERIYHETAHRRRANRELLLSGDIERRFLVTPTFCALS